MATDTYINQDYPGLAGLGINIDNAMGKQIGPNMYKSGVTDVSNQTFNPQTGQWEMPGADMNNWQKFGIGMNAATGLAGALGAYQDYKLKKKQFAFNKEMANRNLANTALTTNRMLKDRAIMAAQMGGGYDYGTDAMVSAADRNYNPVSGAPVGLAAPAQRSLREEITGQV